MRVTRKIIKRVSIVSAVAAIIFFAFAAVYFGFSSTLDYMLVVALTIAVAPPTVVGAVHSIWENKIIKALPDFLRDLATSSRTGIPLQIALEHASKRVYGPLTNELKILVAHMSWGMTFNDALAKFSERIDLPLIKKATTLILESGRHGGDLSSIFESTAKYVDNVNAWTAKRKMQTLPYVAIFYFSVCIFLFIIIIISTMMFTPMSQMSSQGVTIVKPILTPEQSQQIFLHTALLESLFGGLVAGKINEDSFLSGLKHVMILSIVSGLAFYFFFH